MNNFHKMTQEFSTFGNKLMRHTDVLYDIQYNKKFSPITVQIAPTNVCDLKCGYCSVKNRDKGTSIPFDVAIKGLSDFKKLGAKAVEITGGGNPLLYPEINQLIDACTDFGYDIGVISNSTVPKNYISKESMSKLTWIRISMSALDIGRNFDLSEIPNNILSLSYIINEKTTPEIIEIISNISEQYDVKFVRLAPNCLNDDALTINNKWGDVILKQNNPRLFIKEINDNYFPFHSCYVGLIRPYWTPEGIYICSSYVLETQKYEDEYKLCSADDIIEFWNSCNERFANNEMPYTINTKKCYHCYYYNNNEILHTVSNKIKDENFA